MSHVFNQIERQASRVKLPNYLFTLLYPEKPQAPNVVQFRVPTSMNKIQISNYLSEIYKVDVISVHTVIFRGRTVVRGNNPPRKYKMNDWKKAFVTITEPFTFPHFKEGGAGFDEKSVVPGN